MADHTADTFSNAPLGVGAIVGETISIYFKNIVIATLLALIPTVAGIVISGILNGWGYALGMSGPNLATGPAWVSFALDILIQMVVYALATALLVQMAYDAKLNRSLTLGQYFAPALAAAAPIAILGAVVGVLTTLGLALLVIPGLWIYGVYSMVSPAIVIEKAGYGAMKRSAELTRGYRWPVIGAIVIITICATLFGAAIGVGVGLIGYAAGGGMVLSLILVSLATSVGVALGGISISLIYARLREIKEGVSVDQIAEVFD